MIPENKKKYSAAEVYQGVLEGDEEAWGILRRWILIIIKDYNLNLRGETPDDLADIICIALLEKIRKGKAELRDPDAFWKWLIVVSRRCIIDCARGKAYRTQLKYVYNLDPDENQDQGKLSLEDPSPGVEDWLSDVAELDLVIECLQELDEEMRRLFILKMKDEKDSLTPEEKDELNNINCSKAEYSKAKKTVRQCVQLKLYAEENALEWDCLMECLNKLNKDDTRVFALRYMEKTDRLTNIEINELGKIVDYESKYSAIEKQVMECLDAKLVPTRK